MATIPDSFLDTSIEYASENGLNNAADITEQRIMEMTHDQLVAILPYVHIDYGDNDRIDDTELRRVMGEATWREFISGYLAVTSEDISQLF